MDPTVEKVAVESTVIEKERLKPARSQAELVRTRNSNILVCIAIASWVTNLLVAFKVFGIIG